MTKVAVFTFIWIFTQAFREGSFMDYLNFRCDNGKYIINKFFCNGSPNDCTGGDGSDESFGCSRDICGNGRFKCGSEGPCIEITGRCNTRIECPDGSDELNCEHENDIENCSLSEGKFLCQDRLKCLDFYNTCDGACNCFDCSDESSKCTQFDIHSNSCTSCPQDCLPTPTGPQCVCDLNKTEPNKFCRELVTLTEITNSSEDHHISFRFRNVKLYKCYENYHEIHEFDGIKCRKNAWLGQMLLYSTQTKIKMMNITTFNRTEIIQNAINCTTLTAAKEYLYYATYYNKKGSIFKTLINGRKSEKIIELDSTIKSLAVDWITGNLYFTSNKSLLVCSNDGNICTRLKCCGADYVALAPKFGWMFYTFNELGENVQLIMKSNLDGSEEKSLVDRSFHYPTSLAVDEWAETVYCFEQDEKKLYSFSLDGSSKKVYSLSRNEFSTHFSILERYSFFTKTSGNEIYNSTNLDRNFFTTYKDEQTDKIRNLFTYNPHVQFTDEIENPCITSSCGGLCLLRASPDKIYLNYTCVFENFITSDNNSCDHPSRSISQLKSSTKNENLQINPSTEPISTSTSEKEAPRPTGLSIVRPPPPESSSSERYPATGCNNIIISCMTFALGVLMLYFLYQINYSIKRRQIISSSELIEL